MTRIMRGENQNAMLTEVAEGEVACDPAASPTASGILRYVPVDDIAGDNVSAVHGYNVT